MGLWCLKAMPPVLGLLLLFMGSIYEPKAKCFLGLESVSFGNLVKRKAEAELETRQTGGMLSPFSALGGRQGVGMRCIKAARSTRPETPSGAKSEVNLQRRRSNWAVTGSSLRENLGERDGSWTDTELRGAACGKHWLGRERAQMIWMSSRKLLAGCARKDTSKCLLQT